MSHPSTNASISELQSNTPCTPLSEELKHMMHTLGNVENFELCQISHKVQCPHCVKNLMEGIICRLQHLPYFSEAGRLNRERYDVLTTPFFTEKKEQTRELVTVTQNIKNHLINQGSFERKAKKGYESILDRFQNRESHRNSQNHMGWREDFCKHLNALATEDRPYIATFVRKSAIRKRWAMSVNSKRNTISSNSITCRLA